MASGGETSGLELKEAGGGGQGGKSQDEGLLSQPRSGVSRMEEKGGESGKKSDNQGQILENSSGIQIPPDSSRSNVGCEQGGGDRGALMVPVVEEEENIINEIYFQVGNKCEIALVPTNCSSDEIKDLFRSAAEAGPCDIVKLYTLEGRLLNISPYIPPNTSSTPYRLEVVAVHCNGILMDQLGIDLLALDKRVCALEKILKNQGSPCDSIQELKEEVNQLRYKLENYEHLSWLGFYKALHPPPLPTPPRPAGVGYHKKSRDDKQAICDKFLRLCDVVLTRETCQLLREPTFDNWQWEDEEMLVLLQQMYLDLELPRKFDIEIHILRNFLVNVYHHYNDVPFHNFRHCFCVTQMMFGMACSVKLAERIGDLEVLILLTSCICHDLDHPGYNNIYQINAQTELALRYNDISPLENHHCSIAFRLLEDPECNIFRNLPVSTYRKIREGMIRCILATDMARHNDIVSQFREISPNFDYSNKGHINVLTMVLIKVADISNEARPMNVAEPWLDCLLANLSPIESALVSLRIPFLTIRAVGCERQSKLRGNVVNVPNDLDVCALSLPRRFNEASVIQIQLMRRMRYKVPYLYDKIRPLHVYRAMHYLMTTELYQKSNVILCDDWARCQEDETMDFNYDPETGEQGPDALNPEINNHQAEACGENVDGGREVEDTACIADVAEEATSANETLIIEDLANVLRIAPAEGQKPIGLCYDDLAEEMSFPTIYCGVARKIAENIRISYTDIAKSELRRYDRRGTHPTKVLYSFKKSYNEKVNQAYQICLRKKRGGHKLTASDVLRPDILANIMQHDEGYAIYKQVRCTPAYWADKSKDLVAMVRTLGKCSVFLTLSAAETKWWELIVILKKSVDKEDITETQAKDLSHGDIARLIRLDPTNCMRHFEHRFEGFVKFLLKGECGVFGQNKLIDYFFRMEFQVRGSPHIHALLWLDNAPEFVEACDETELACAKFIDKLITCKRNPEGRNSQYIGYQLHKHSHTCYRKPNKKDGCRFGFPKPPMPKTCILLPLSEDYTETQKKQLLDKFKVIQNKLTVMGRDFTEDVPLENFLDSLGLTIDDYILAIRANLRRPTVFLKRSTDSIFVNSYNPKILEAWAANMDIQYVLDTYACARYCAGYITKPDGGLSKLLHAVVQDSRQGNLSVREKLKKLGNMLINGSEISVQEAVAFILGIGMLHCSRQVRYINTCPPEDRISMLKNPDELEKLIGTSEDICTKGLIDHYIQRPDTLDELCLAEFTSMFEFETQCKGDVMPATQPGDTLNLPGSPFPRFRLKDSSGYVRKRNTGKVIRFRRYSAKTDPTNYYREQLMLFVPWRNEQMDLIEINSEMKAKSLADIIRKNSKIAYHREDIDEELITAAMDEVDLIQDIDESVVENENRIQDDNCNRDEDMREEPSNELDRRAPRVVQFLPPKFISEHEFHLLMRSLNDRQRRFVLNVMYQLKSSGDPVYHFLHGGAGVGKSHTINAIVQSCLRWYLGMPDKTPQDVPVIVSAFTGKAAWNVFGMTLHCAFKVPPNQSNIFVGLNASALSALRLKFQGVKLIIIDEISMVGSKLLYQVDQRLRQIFSNNAAFGGISVIVVGHLRQLPPVAASHVFKTPKHVPLGEITGNTLWELFQFYELTEIKRQEGQFAFCKALNNMSEGTMDEDDIALIRAREITDDSEVPVDAIRLFFTNKECLSYNQSVHSSMSTEGATSYAYDRIEGRGTPSVKASMLNYAKSLTKSQSDGLSYEVPLKVGCMYFVTTNIDVQDGLFNGATGKLMKIEYGTTSTGLRIPKCAWIDFKSSLIGINSRSKTNSYQLANGIDVSWVRIDRLTRNLQKRETDLISIVRTQIPLVPANGITIHKSQGSSLQNVVVDLRNVSERSSNFRELMYVACSRATSLDGLQIFGNFKNPRCGTNDMVGKEILRLRNNPVQFNIRFLQDFGPETTKLYFHNIQSFPFHREDFRSDQCCQAADFVAIVEPKIIAADLVSQAGFTTLHRTNSSSRQSSDGVLVFAKADLTLQQSLDSFEPRVERISSGSSHLTILKWQIQDKTVYTIYKSPKFPSSQFFTHLENILITESDTIITGDMNINLSEQLILARVESMLSKRGFSLKLDPNTPTTSSNTHIDWCVANFAACASIYETYYSHHKAICVTW